MRRPSRRRCGIWLWPAALLGLALVVLAAGGCYNPDLRTVWAEGTQLRMGVGAIRTTDQIVFESGGRQQVLRPTEGRTFAAAPVTIVNTRSGKTLFFVDESAASLRDQEYDSYELIDPFDRAVPAEEPYDADTVRRFTPFIWGDVTLEQGFQLSGWLIFEVPPDREWQELEWNQGDTMLARLKPR